MRDNHRDVFLPEEINRPETELSETKALMDCGHPKACRTDGMTNYYNHRADGTIEAISPPHCTVCAELFRREADLHKMYNERMDALNERFDQQRTREQAEARASCAALLHEVADYMGDCSGTVCKNADPHWAPNLCMNCEYREAVLKHIPTDAATALAEVKRKARLEMRERTALRVQHQADQLKQHYQSGVVGLGWADLYELAENIRATPLETDAELRAEKEQ